MDCLLIHSDFFGNAIGNVIGTLAGGFLLYYFLERNLKKRANEQNKKKLLLNYIGELAHNIYIAEYISKVKEVTLNVPGFPIKRFRTDATLRFYYEKPIEELKKKDYDSISNVLGNLEAENLLIDQMFISKNDETAKENKMQLYKYHDLLLKQLKILLRQAEKSVK